MQWYEEGFQEENQEESIKIFIIYTFSRYKDYVDEVVHAIEAINEQREHDRLPVIQIIKSPIKKLRNYSSIIGKFCYAEEQVKAIILGAKTTLYDRKSRELHQVMKWSCNRILPLYISPSEKFYEPFSTYEAPLIGSTKGTIEDWLSRDQ